MAYKETVLLVNLLFHKPVRGAEVDLDIENRNVDWS